MSFAPAVNLTSGGPLQPAAETPSYHLDLAKLINVPQWMKDLPNFVVWKYEDQGKKNPDGSPKLDKIPYDAKTGKRAKPDEATTWCDFTTAVNAANEIGSDYEGIGFEFSESPYSGFDFDGVLTERKVEPYITAILKLLGKPYCEVSPSGTGFKAFVEGKLPKGVRNKVGDGNHYGAEFYSRSRYFTITGDLFSGKGIPKIEDLSIPHFLTMQILDKEFKHLWLYGDEGKPPYGKDRSASGGDFQLVRKLMKAIPTKDPAILDKYFRASTRVQDPVRKEKWDRLGAQTISNALKYADNPINEKSNEGPHGIQIEAHWNLDMVPLSQIKAAIQPWLWENRLPMNALSNISGIADQGKSLVLYDILARISTGSDFPDGAKNPFGEPKKVLLFFSEGSLETTVKPRLTVMNANMDNIIAIKSMVKQEDTADKRQFCLDRDLATLRKALVDNPDIAVIAFDPITSYVGDDCNINSPQDVRKVLTPLGIIAEEHPMTILSIVHFSKNTLADAIHRTGGASTWVDFPRAAWCCSADKSSEDKSTFIFSRQKNNLGKRIGGITYRIAETFIDIDGKRSSQPTLIWGTRIDKSAEEVLNTEREVGKTDTDAAKEWLVVNFPDDDARPAKATKDKARVEEISEYGFDRARVRLRMQSKLISGHWWMRRNQDKDNRWHEHLQEDSPSLSDSPSGVEVE